MMMVENDEVGFIDKKYRLHANHPSTGCHGWWLGLYRWGGGGGKVSHSLENIINHDQYSKIEIEGGRNDQKVSCFDHVIVPIYFIFSSVFSK